MMLVYPQKVIELFNKNKNIENAFSMKKYMRNQFEFLGIKTPIRREISKNLFTKEFLYNQFITENVLYLWNLPEREYQYFAIDFLLKKKKDIKLESFELIDFITLNKSWWDTVDTIATKIVPEYFKLYPNELIKQSKRLNESDNIWQNRISILFQLHYKNKTDTELLSKYILNHSASKEFFIQKSIGWSLREYYKTNPNWVIDFVNNNDLKPLSKREALKNHK